MGVSPDLATRGNGLIRALPSWQVDLALTKETRLTERFSMEFALQAFNIL